MNNAGQFYTNRVLKDWKEKSKVNSIYQINLLENLETLSTSSQNTGIERNLVDWYVTKNCSNIIQIHVEWVKAWIETLAQLQIFVKEHYTTGLTWNTGIVIS